MYILIGFGNPGRRYKKTRHNIGFLLLDYIAEKFDIPFSTGKGDYYFVQGNIDGSPAMLVKPTTYMNNSGLVLNQLKEKFVGEDVDISNLIGTEQTSDEIKDVIQALLSLGYKRGQINDALKKIKEDGVFEGSVEDLIKKALTNM